MHDFDELVRTYHDQLIARARLLCADEGLAEDAVQETLVSAWRALPTLPPDVNLGGWLHRVLANNTVDQHRQREREARRVAALGGVERAVREHAPDPAGVVDDRLAVRAALTSLGEEHRSALLLRDLGGHDYEAIAASSGTTATNIRARVHRARTTMRTHLESSGVRRVSWIGIALGILLVLLIWWFTSRSDHDEPPPSLPDATLSDRSGDASAREPGPGAGDLNPPAAGGEASGPNVDRATPLEPRAEEAGGREPRANVVGQHGLSDDTIFVAPRPADEEPVTPGSTTTTSPYPIDRPGSGALRGAFTTDAWEGREPPKGLHAEGLGAIYGAADERRALMTYTSIDLRQLSIRDGSFVAEVLASGPDGTVWLRTSGSAALADGGTTYLLRGAFLLAAGGDNLPLSGAVGLSLRVEAKSLTPSDRIAPRPVAPVPVSVPSAPPGHGISAGPGIVVAEIYDDLDQDSQRDAEEGPAPGGAADAHWFGPDGVADTDDDELFQLAETDIGRFVAEDLPLGTYRVTVSLADGWQFTGGQVDDVPTRSTIVSIIGFAPKARVELPAVQFAVVAGSVYVDHLLDATFAQPLDDVPYVITRAGDDDVLDTADDVVTRGLTANGQWFHSSMDPGLIRVTIDPGTGWEVVREPRGGPLDGSFVIDVAPGRGPKDLHFVLRGSSTAELDIRPAPGFQLPEAIDVAVVGWGFDGQLGTRDDIVAVGPAEVRGGRVVLTGLPPGRVTILLDRTVPTTESTRVTRPEEAVRTIDVGPGASVQVPFRLEAE